MKILLSWLTEYIQIDQSPEEIAKILTMAGLEVDAVETIALKAEGVVVCKVLAVEKHPQADKLCLATVSDGQETMQVVCGAPNCHVGMKAALAKVGARVCDADGKIFAIKKSKIRGVESLGMLCAADELGLPPSGDGIIELASHINEGTNVAELYADTVFEISLTPNLGHCASVLGVARELAAATGKTVNFPQTNVEEDLSSPVSSAVRVEVKNPQACPRYACRIMRGVAIGPSPDWLKSRLELSGIRSINNVVDVTNYVMLEFGHPLHAFDYDLLVDQRLEIKNAKPAESFTTLDGKERFLEDYDLLICDGAKPVALAGIMGGINSEVSESTKNLLIEAAYFAPSVVRRTSKHLGLMTDASKRFERGCDPNFLLKAINRVIMLIQQIGGGIADHGAIDIAAKKFDKKCITCRLKRINDLLGTHLNASEVETIFTKLDFIAAYDGQGGFSVEVPTYRNDVQEEIDLVEEVARIYGYDNIDKTSCRFRASMLPHAPIFIFERKVRSRLISEGLQEFLTCDLIGPTILHETLQASEMPEKLWVRVVNPTSVEQSILRTSLLPGLLETVKYNWDHQNQDIAGFEVGRIHFKDGEQYREQTMASIVLSGKSRPMHWDEKPKEYDFFDLKGIVENLLSELKVADVKFKSTHLKTLHPGRQASIFVGNLELGSLGEIHPSILRRLDVPQRILFAEINLHDLYKVKSEDVRMRAIPMYPGSERDWTVTLEEDLPIGKIFDAIHSISSKVLESVALLDVYRSDKLGKGLKNVTLRFLYRDKEKTISQEKVDAEHAHIIEHVLKHINTIPLSKNH